MKLVLVRAQQVRYRLRWASSVGFGALAGALLMGHFAPTGGGGVLASPVAKVEQSCRADLKAAQRRARQLNEESAYLKQSVIVEQEACFGVRDSLQDKQNQISDLREQLAFYRGIVSPEESSLGVRIHGLDVRQVKNQIHNFRLTLLQSVREGGDAAGRASIKLEVLQDSQVQSLDLQDLLVAGEYSGQYEFRYYAELYGEFKLPAGVRPLRMVVALTPKGKRRATVVKTFVWDDIMAGRTAKEVR